jgi:hypothetical protein
MAKAYTPTKTFHMANKLWHIVNTTRWLLVINLVSPQQQAMEHIGAQI